MDDQRHLHGVDSARLTALHVPPCFCGGKDASLGQNAVVKPTHRVLQNRRSSRSLNIVESLIDVCEVVVDGVGVTRRLVVIVTMRW